MNAIIEHYFQTIEIALITHSQIINYQIVNRTITNEAGKIRIRCHLISEDVLEFFNYVKVVENTVILDKYSFHWQNKAGIVKKRWDNAPHHLSLINAPHHLHIGLDIIQPVEKFPDIFQILQWITE